MTDGRDTFGEKKCYRSMPAKLKKAKQLVPTADARKQRFDKFFENCVQKLELWIIIKNELKGKWAFLT